MFELHERLAADTVEVGDLDVCKVLLMKNAYYPWLILVPRIEEVVELTDLEEEVRQLLMAEISDVSSVIQKKFSVDKINIGALGNMVPQLHIHVLGRFKTDPAWPGPVWGHPEVKAYSEAEIAQLVKELQEEIL